MSSFSEVTHPYALADLKHDVAFGVSLDVHATAKNKNDWREKTETGPSVQPL